MNFDTMTIEELNAYSEKTRRETAEIVGGTKRLRDASVRLKRASINAEAPEVIHALMLDVADVLDSLGYDSTDPRRSASTIVPMFGLRDQRRGWFDKWRNGKTTDFTPTIEAYRKDIK